jgi:hypothetical protein
MINGNIEIEKNPTFLITCPIFENELKAVLPSDPAITIHKMDYSIHTHPDRMKKELFNAISKAEETGATIRLLVGKDCECELPISEIADRCNAQHPQEKNCIEIILGAERAGRLQEDRTMLITPAWIRMIRKAIEDGLWNEVDARINIGWYDRILLMDPDLEPVTDDEIFSFFDLVRVPIETEKIDLDHFRSVVARLIY